jgi:hypothetical protein
MAQEYKFPPVALPDPRKRLVPPEHYAAFGLGQTGEDAQQAGLARAILTLHAEDLAFSQREAESAKEPASAANAVEIDGLEHGKRRMEDCIGRRARL